MSLVVMVLLGYLFKYWAGQGGLWWPAVGPAKDQVYYWYVLVEEILIFFGLL